MAKYSYITDKTHNNRKIQVESAKRDGSGKNIENNYAKQNGNYQSLTAGLSNNFDTKKVMVDESAYNFRPTATMGSVELEVGSPCKVKKIVGGSVVFNQIFYVRNTAETYGSLTLTPNTTDNSFTLNGTGSGDATYMTISGVDLPIGYLANGHKYIITGVTALFSKATTLSGDTAVHIPNAGCQTNPYTGTLKADTVFAVTNNNTSVTRFYLYLHNGDSWNNAKGYINLIDLTKMFGSTIADYIYSLEQANAGSGVAWFKRYFPKEYYAYNSGELVSVKTQGKKITHFNQWDEELEQGGINSNDGSNNNSATTNSRSKNYMQVVPNTTYYWRTSTNSSYGGGGRFYYYDINKVLISYYDTYVNRTFITPANCYYVRFTTWSYSAYNHDICINFHYDGDRDGEYEPYNSEPYPCDDVELLGIPQLDENNNLAFDGDEYANDGNVTRKYGSYTFTGNEVWSASSNAYQANITGLSNLVKKASDNREVFSWQINNAGLKATSGSELYIGRDTSGIAVITNGNIFIGSDDYANRSNLVGKTIIFELATPTDENSIPFTEVQECDNWGTEEWLAPTTDTRPCEVPVGHETDYLPDLKAKVEVAPNTPNENGVYVMEHNASGNSYTPIATWLTDNGYKTEETMKDTFGMKDALGGTLKNILSVKENIGFNNTNFVELYSFTWYYNAENQTFYTSSALSDVVQTGYVKCISTKYEYHAVSGSSMNDKTCKIDGGRIYVKDTAYTDATTFKNAMKGVLFAYEKAS